MKVSVVVGGRFHAFDLAAHLHRRGVLHRLVTNYPKFAARRWGIPPDRVVSLPGTLIAARALSKVSSQLVRRNQYRLHRWFAKAAAKKLEGSDLVMAWSSFAEPSVAWARERGVPTLVERVTKVSIGVVRRIHAFDPAAHHTYIATFTCLRT
jgi:hypothetical protein